MLFFDDAKAGKYGYVRGCATCVSTHSRVYLLILFVRRCANRRNCEPVAALGVMAAHCPQRLTVEVWQNAVRQFCDCKANGAKVGRVVDSPGIMAPGIGSGGGSQVQLGVLKDATVVKWFDDKGFGFVHVDGHSKDIFCHQSVLPPGVKSPIKG